MSKILRSVLERISENNNEYRKELRTLNSDIDERTTNLVGTLITESNYTLDFSTTLEKAKEEVVNPVSRIIESYVIRDLRSVETVNEQFVEKINDKLENTNINSNEEKEAFSNNLNSLLNDKYLEIVKIKRVNFFNENGVNDEVEEKINMFISAVNASLKTKIDFSEAVKNYKLGLYDAINVSLAKISNLYQNNFINEVSSSLESAVDYSEPVIIEDKKEEIKPYVPEVNVSPEVPSFDNTKVVSGTTDLPTVPVIESGVVDLPAVPTIETGTTDLPPVPTIDTEKTVELPVIDEPLEEANVIEVAPVSPIEVVEDQPEEKEVKAAVEPKHEYGVDEILKIAKSPILEMPEKVEKKQDNSYISIEPITIEKEGDAMTTEFDEVEIVNEMIRRLQDRLLKINDRKEKYEIENDKLSEDEAFVNDLIESSKLKKEELDKFESELDAKEEELNRKQKELDKKISDVIPFAKAVLNTEKES